MKREELKSKLNELGNSIVTDPERLKEFTAQWANGFYSYSMNNYLLASMQRPELTLLAGFNTWKKKGRYIKKGEKGIWIMAPMVYKNKAVLNDALGDETEEKVSYVSFKPVAVFDITQTEGEPVEIGCSNLVRKADVRFDSIAKLAPVPVTTQQATMSNGYTDGKTIVITEKENEASMVATLIHEWAHVVINHMENDKLSRNIKELEAEAVSYIVCCFLNIENNKSALYLGNWSGTKETLTNQGPRILKTAEGIIGKIRAA